jgi:hypothetical protein
MTVRALPALLAFAMSQLIAQPSATGSLNVARVYHTATLLNNGLVLVAGGFIDQTNTPTAISEIYNPQTGLGGTRVSGSRAT